MAVKLNLLPEGYTLTGPTAQIVKVARPLNVILLGVFMVMILGMGGFFIFSSISLNSLNASNSDLENQIQSQSTAQQQIVLLKDRLGKIKTVQAMPNASKNLSSMDTVLSSVTDSSVLSELDVDSSKIASSIIFKSNSDLTNFLKNLGTNTLFSSVSMGTFNYAPNAGYQVGLIFLGK